MAALDPSAPGVDTIRAFNRFYTRRIGALKEGLAATPFSLTESRLLWELAHREHLTATDLARDLSLDNGYLSRLLQGLKQRGLIAGERRSDDARHVHLRLTPAGRRAFAPLDMRAQAEAAALLVPLTADEQQQLLQAVSTVQRLLSRDAPRGEPYLLRPHHAGDMGWVIARHGALYAEEYRWDSGFEALVARIAAQFLDRYNPATEACWIAERDHVNVGCVVLVQARDDASGEALEGVAQLRLLLVEPAARGLGIGRRLVAECERFARQAGYRRIVLWTNDVLTGARAIYARAGYRLQTTAPHHSFGQDLVAETWELKL